MRIDLHTHSSVSDGTEPPRVLVAKAAAAGLDVVGLADHDTTDGWAEAESAGAEHGVDVVPAIEVSTAWHGVGIHLLALWPDGGDSGLVGMLASIRDGREHRISRMIAALTAHGVTITEDDVRREAADAAAVGRPHVADALVRAGVVGSREQAFAEWIGDGKPGHVHKPAPLLPRAIDVILAAGGVPVLAHPWGRASRRVLDDAAIAALADAGLVGVEVEHVDHDDADRSALTAIAERHGLVATGGSDYHGAGKAGVGLGLNTCPEPAYQQLLARRGVAAGG